FAFPAWSRKLEPVFRASHRPIIPQDQTARLSVQEGLGRIGSCVFAIPAADRAASLSPAVAFALSSQSSRQKGQWRAAELKALSSKKSVSFQTTSFHTIGVFNLKQVASRDTTSTWNSKSALLAKSIDLRSKRLYRNLPHATPA